MAAGAKLYTFEGHEDAVHSVCPHSKDNVHVGTLFDTSILLLHPLYLASYGLSIFSLSKLKTILLYFQFIFSTSVDGKIKAWLYDMMGPRVDYDAPGHSCAAMAYSADGKRLVC